MERKRGKKTLSDVEGDSERRDKMEEHIFRWARGRAKEGGIETRKYDNIKEEAYYRMCQIK